MPSRMLIGSLAQSGAELNSSRTSRRQTSVMTTPISGVIGVRALKVGGFELTDSALMAYKSGSLQLWTFGSSWS
jgi:hypothetical protein